MLLLGLLFVIMVIGVIAGVVANSLRSSETTLQNWNDRALIDRAKTIDVFDPKNERKIRKLIDKLAVIAVRNREAGAVRAQLVRLLKEWGGKWGLNPKLVGGLTCPPRIGPVISYSTVEVYLILNGNLRSAVTFLSLK